jgi:hypothetical protein
MKEYFTKDHTSYFIIGVSYVRQDFYLFLSVRVSRFAQPSFSFSLTIVPRFPTSVFIPDSIFSSLSFFLYLIPQANSKAIGKVIGK